jgi:hypothetical protein
MAGLVRRSLGEGEAGDVAAEPLQSLTIRAGNVHACMQGEPVLGGAARPGQGDERGVGLAADPGDACTAFVAERDAALDRPGVARAEGGGLEGGGMSVS